MSADETVSRVNRPKDPAAVALGRRGGLAGKGKTSPAKAAAARANGRKGGAPKGPRKGLARKASVNQSPEGTIVS